MRWIVPSPPGGGYDAYSRLLEPHLERGLGVSIHVDNMPGAGGVRGATALSQAAPDGSTLGILNMPGLLMASLTNATAPDPFSSFTLLGSIARTSYIWASRAGSDIRTPEDLAAISRRRGLVVGVSSSNNVGYLSSALALQMLGWKARFVSGYGGSVEKAMAAMRGEVDITPLSWDVLIDYVRSGELQPVLAISHEATSRHSPFTGVPALDGSGGLIARLAPDAGSDLNALVRFMHAGRALAAPARLPAEVLACLSSAVCHTLSSPALESAGEAARTPVQAVCAASLQRELRSLEGDVSRLAQLAPEAMRRVRQ